MPANCFTPHHRLLLYEAYPKGRALAEAGSSGYTPLSNPLSQLSYYCSTRSQKLAKVGKALREHVQKDAPRSGTSAKAKSRLCISLAIVLRLVSDCRSNLSSFSGDVLQIVQIALSAKDGTGKAFDVDVVERAAAVFTAFAAFAEESMLGIDEQLSKDYLACLEIFGQVAQFPRKDNARISHDFRLIGLKALYGAINAETLSISQMTAQYRIFLTALLENLRPDHISSSVLAEASAKADEGAPSSASALSGRPPLSDRKPQSVRRMKYTGDKEKAEEEVVVASQAALNLRSLCRQTPSSQQRALIDALTLFLDTRPDLYASADWLSWVAQSCAHWSPLLVRYGIVNHLLLSAVELDSKSAEKQLALVNMTKSILSSQISLTGLATSETLHRLLSILTQNITSSNTQTLESATLQCIQAINTHLYYSDQASDLARDLLGNIAALASASLPPLDATVEAQHVSIILKHIVCLLGMILPSSNAVDTEAPQASSLNRSSSKQQRRNPISISHWFDTLFILTYTDPAVRLAYGRALILFIRNEMPAQIVSDKVLLAHFSDSLTVAVFKLLQGQTMKRTRASTQGSARSSQTPTPSRISPASEAIIASPSGTPSQHQLSDKLSIPNDADLVAAHDILFSAVELRTAEPTLAIVPMLRTALVTFSNSSKQQAFVQSLLCETVSRWTNQSAASNQSIKYSRLVDLESGNISVANERLPAPMENVDLTRMIETLAASQALQQTSSLDQSQLQDRFQMGWTVEKALSQSFSRAGSLNNRLVSGQRGSPVRPLPGNESNIAALKNPSVADLKASLLLHPSRSSLHGHDQQQSRRRRSSAVPTPEQLALLGIRQDPKTLSTSPLSVSPLSTEA